MAAAAAAAAESELGSVDFMMMLIIFYCLHHAALGTKKVVLFALLAAHFCPGAAVGRKMGELQSANLCRLSCVISKPRKRRRMERARLAPAPEN